ncbi:MAG: tRNA lysidine(34) synthetase TilS [Clostridia bacterium]|nr:tRNA lysidine(34) synthetase TilS [Clostridia bacterium]
MKEKIIETIRKYGLLEGCKGLVLCISGGSDSMSLLHFFCENKGLYGIPFVVAHINHGLRAESIEEEAGLIDFCKKNSVPIEVLHADISGSKPKGKSTEEYAREVRYSFFEEVRDKYGYTHIATAHNADDNSETVLLNLIRGCGVGGLCGIPVKRDDGVVRPLILCTKKEIYEYCENNKIVFYTDKTNFENLYTRNLIRNEIIPIIKRINPSFNEAVARLTEAASADDTYLENIVDSYMNDPCSVTENKELSLKFLNSLPDSILPRFIRRYFFVNSSNIVLTNKQTNDIIGLIKKAKTSKKTEIEGFEISIGYDSLVIREKNTAERKIITSEIFLGENILPEVGVLTVSEAVATKENIKDCIAVKDCLTVRSRCSGDSLKLPNRPSKTLKKLFIDDKIPSDKRALIPVISCGEDIVWVFGYGADEKFRPEVGEMALYLKFKHF